MNEWSSLERRKIENQVVKAFQDVPYPGDDNIVPAKKYRNLEAEGVANYLRGKSWRDLNYESIYRDYPGDSSAILAFLSLPAFHFFYPGFLLISLNEFDSADMTALAALRVFDDDSRFAADVLDFKRRRTQVFSSEQLAAIQAAMVWLQKRFGSGFSLELDDAASGLSNFMRRLP
ncbi:MAG: hypothetical protein HC855_12440 [Rhizobiales bacterium]|nr:hypothetical protein [Hyphomicrobiales bacterium]